MGSKSSHQLAPASARSSRVDRRLKVAKNLKLKLKKMSSLGKFVFIFLSAALTTWSATHDEIAQCSLTGIYRTRQSVLESPNYPDNYPANTCWDYVVRSPYRCPTKFHIQFLDFFLESSRNCSRDYLAIGLENDGEDMDLLCGQVIGIKKFHTPDGILRLRFFSDDSPWTTGKGFKLLVTRLACERDDPSERDNLDENDEDTEEVNAPSTHLELPQTNLPELFRNLSLDDQHKPFAVPPVFGGHLPPQHFPAPPLPPGYNGFYLPVHQYPQRQRPAVSVQRLDPPGTKEKPCKEETSKAPQPPHQYRPILGYQQLPELSDASNAWHSEPALKSLEYPQSRQAGLQPITPIADSCCSSSFRQKRFYLSSPGFPRTVFTALLPTQQRDCEFHVEKSVQNVCRLRVEFKFFDFGQTYSGTGSKQGNIEVAIGTSKDVCTEDYLQIDNERFCGCRSGYVYTAQWGLGKKSIRMRMGYSGVPSNGFLLEIFQEECTATQFVKPQYPVQNVGFPENGISNFGAQPQQPNELGLGLGATQFGGQQANRFPGGYSPLQQTGFGQQPIYPHLLPAQHFNLQQAPYQPLLPPGALYAQQQQQQQQQLWDAAMLSRFGPQGAQFRSARELSSTQQPVTVVETNSTRKEYYYFDGDDSYSVARSRTAAAPQANDVRRADLRDATNQRSRCTFEMGDILRLSVDSLWLTKPTCYTPVRSWFNNVFG